MADYTGSEMTPVEPEPMTDGCLNDTTTHYKMRGYYAADEVWEIWVTTGIAAPAPSGHTLTDTVLVATWTT